MKLIAIVSSKQQGKSSITNFLVKNHDFISYSFANPMKRGLQEMFGFTDEQLWGGEEEKEKIDDRWGISARRMLQIVGTDLFQFDIQNRLKLEEQGFKDIGRKIWVHKFKLWLKETERIHKLNFIESKIAGLINGEIPELRIVIDDCRFIHECNEIKNLGGEIWRVIRPNKENIDNHLSETEHNAIKEDKLLINDGSLEELYEKIEKFII